MNSSKLAFIYIQKSRDFVLGDVFIYKKPDASKKQDNLRYIFLYTKSLTLCITRFFMEILKLAEGVIQKILKLYVTQFS